jgi:hypothetical protein
VDYVSESEHSYRKFPQKYPLNIDLGFLNGLEAENMLALHASYI